MSWLQPPRHDRSPPETDIAVTLIDPCGGEPGTKASHDQCTQACNHSAINAIFGIYVHFMEKGGISKIN